MVLSQTQAGVTLSVCLALGCSLCTSAFLPGVWYIVTIPQQAAVCVVLLYASLRLFTSVVQLSAATHFCLPDKTR